MKKETVIITGLPWLRTGTGKVMEAQVEFFHSIGWNVIFVACPHTGGQTYSDSVWDRFKQYAGDLNADFVFIASFEKRVRPRGFFRKLNARLKNLNVMDWRIGISRSATITPEMRECIQNADVKLILVNHVYTLELGQRIKRELLSADVPLCVVTHDVQSHILLDNDVQNPFTKRCDPVAALEKTEVRALSVAECLIHVSHADMEFFQRRLPGTRQAVVFPCARDHTGRSHDTSASETDFLFLGSNHVANFDAVVWLLEHVYPKFSKPEPSLRIAGSVDGLVRERRPDLYERFRSHFVGEVPDPISEYRATRCVLIPMISGRGISIKTIEAVSSASPIVGATAAFRGMPPGVVEDAGLRVYREPADFAAAAEEVLKSPDSFRESSVRLYKSLFAPEAFADSMWNVLADLGLKQHRDERSREGIATDTGIGSDAA